MALSPWLGPLTRGFVLALTFLSLRSFAGPALAIPARGDSLQAFVPNGYVIGDEVHSDFSGKGGDDIAALLWISPESTEPRPLIVLLHQADGSYRLSARTDIFTLTNLDACGAGNASCLPDIQAKGRALTIRMARGSAGAYRVYENEFRLLRGVWYRVRHADYSLGDHLECSTPSRDDERCLEEGVSVDERTGVLIKYSKFFDPQGRMTHVVQSKSNAKKSPLETLKGTEW